jgi:sporulation protein YqfC
MDGEGGTIMRTWKQRVRRAATEWLSLPPDALLNVSRLTCLDGGEVIVENIHSLLRVADTAVEIDLGNSLLTLSGERFVVTLVAEREVHVRGVVGQISYLPKKGGQT